MIHPTAVIDPRAELAPDVIVEEFCSIQGRVTIGAGAVIHAHSVLRGGGEVVTKDVPPFAAMRWGGLKGYNAVGCRRSEMGAKASSAVRAAFHRIHAHRSLRVAMEELAAAAEVAAEVREIVEFIKLTRRGVLPSARYLGASRGGADGHGAED